MKKKPDMKEVFQVYSNYYDFIYLDKNYEKECDFLEEIFRKYASSIPKTVLDLGCGTGNHAIPLSKRGFTVTGVDASQGMITIAKEKARKNKADIDFRIMDMRKLQLNKKFDACIAMFTVVGYITENRDLEKVFQNIRRHINKGSLVLFDFWYGPAVLTIGPTPKMKTVEKKDLQVFRFAQPRLDTYRNLIEVNYSLIVTDGKKIVDKVKERHMVRYFFPNEIQHYLEDNSIKLLKLCSFLELNAEPTEDTWNVMAIAQGI